MHHRETTNTSVEPQRTAHHGGARRHAQPARGLRHGHPHGTAEPRRSWAPLIVLAIAQFMVILDVTVVNVALPSIGEALAFGAARLQWVITAYVLFTGGLMLLGGRMADLLGARRVFGSGLLLFTAASAASGLAGTAGVLIAARAAQGV